MATHEELQAAEDTERKLLREQAGLRPRMERLEAEITRLKYEGRLEDDVEVQTARADLDALRNREDAIPAELLQARRARLDALETLLPATAREKRLRIRDFREAQRQYGVEALNPARCNLKRSGLDVPA